MSAGRGDEIAGQVAAADVVEVADDSEGLHGRGPVGIEIGSQGSWEGGVEGGCGEEGKDGTAVEIEATAGMRKVGRESRWHCEAPSAQYREAFKCSFPTCSDWFERMFLSRYVESGGVIDVFGAME